MHSIHLLKDLGVVLLCAAVVAVFFHRFKIPVFLGYLLSGVLVGPHLLSSAPVHNMETVHGLSELGVIFLMFYIGMEFDLRRLKQILGPTSLALVLETALFLFLGLQLAPTFGWGVVDGFFLGALLAISSSMVTVAILEDLGRMKKQHAHLALGVLVLEDILAVTLLVVLTGVAVTGSFDWSKVLGLAFFIAVFVVAVFALGRLGSTRVIKLLHRAGSVELITLCTIAWVLGIGLLASLCDFSVALGAFLAGAVLSQSQISKEIEAATQPLRHIFCAIFFVSAGMLIKPEVFLSEWWVIVGISLLVVVGKVASVWFGLVASGQNSDTSFRAATAKAQIGEFSFVIAGLGQSLQVTSDSLMTIAVGVSVLTTVMSLLLSQRVDPIYGKLAENTPKTVKTLGAFYRNVLESVRSGLKRNIILLLIRRPALQITINFLLINGILWGSFAVIEYLNEQEALAIYSPIITPLGWLLAAAACLPLVIAVIRNLNAVAMILFDSAFKGAKAEPAWKNRFHNIFSGFFVVLVVLVVVGIYLSLASQYLPSGVGLLSYLLLIVLIGIAFKRHWIRINSRWELMFMESFNKQFEEDEAQRRENALKLITEKYPWPVKIFEVVVPAGSVAAGKTLAKIELREKTGTTVVAVSRSDLIQYDLGPDFVIFPSDRLYLFGSAAQQSSAFQLLAQKSPTAAKPDTKPSFELEKVYLGRDSELPDNTLAGAHLRQNYGITVLGIQRQETRITAPSPQEILAVGDILYVTGDASGIRRIREAAGERTTGGK